MFKTFIVYSLVIIFAIVVEGDIIHGAFPSFPAPDFIFILVLMLALRERSLKALWLAFFLGLVGDFASGEYLGPNAAGCVVGFWAVSLIAEKIYAERGFAVVVIGFLGTLAKSITANGLIWFQLKIDFSFVEWAKIAGGEALLTAIFAPLVIGFVSWATKGKSRNISSVSSSYQRGYRRAA